MEQVLLQIATAKMIEYDANSGLVVDEDKRRRDAEEMGDTMKSLENRTLDSKREMDILAALDEMKSLKSWEKIVVCHSPRQGLMPASFKVNSVAIDVKFEKMKDVWNPDFSESAIDGVAPVDSDVRLQSTSN